MDPMSLADSLYVKTLSFALDEEDESPDLLPVFASQSGVHEISVPHRIE
jgi:hypothetical protein